MALRMSRNTILQRYFLPCITPFLLAVPSAMNAAPIPPHQEIVMSNEQLEALGKALRSDIEQEIKRLDSQGGFRVFVDVTPMARKYFKIGMPFSEAEIIMKGAGMEITSRRVRPGEDLPDDRRHDIDGHIGFDVNEFNQSRVACNVQLFAKFLSPSDITIQDVSAIIAFRLGL